MDNKTLETIAKTADGVSTAGWGYLTVEFALTIDSLRGIGAPFITGFLTYLKGKDIFVEKNQKSGTKYARVGLTIAGIILGAMGTVGAVTGNNNLAKLGYATCAATLGDALARYARLYKK